MLNQVIRYTIQHNWCLFQTRINWEHCYRKAMWHKNDGDDGGGGIDSPDGVASSQIVIASACYLPLHHKTQKMACKVGNCEKAGDFGSSMPTHQGVDECFFWYGSPA